MSPLFRFLLAAALGFALCFGLYHYRWQRAQARIQALEVQLALENAVQLRLHAEVERLAQRVTPVRVIVQRDSALGLRADTLQGRVDSLVRRGAADSAAADSILAALAAERAQAQQRIGLLLNAVQRMDSLLQVEHNLRLSLERSNALLRAEITELNKKPPRLQQYLPVAGAVLATMGACHLARC